MHEFIAIYKPTLITDEILYKQYASLSNLIYIKEFSAYFQSKILQYDNKVLKNSSKKVGNAYQTRL